MSRKEVLTLVFVLCLAFGLRFSGIGFESVWLDESYQSLVEAYGNGLPDLDGGGQPFLFSHGEPGSTEEVLKNFSKVDEVCPPLYGVLLNAFIRLLGGSDIAIRFLSTLASTAAVAGVYVIGRMVFNGQTAVLAAILAAVSPFAIFYGQEARMYSLAELSAVLSFGSLIILCRRLKVASFVLPWLVYVMSTWALINSHYTTLFVAAAGGLWGLWQIIQTRSLKLFLVLCAAWLAVALIWLPWLGYFFGAAAVRKRSFYVARQFSLWWPVYALFVKVPINWFSYLAGKRVAVIPLWATSASFVLLAIGKTIEAARTRDNDKFNSLLALWCWAIVPALGIWLIDVLENHRVIEISRYLIGTAPAIYILCGAALTFVSRRYKFWFYLFLVHVVLCLSNTVYQHIVPQKEPWRQMAQMVESKVQNEMLFVCQPYDIVCLDRYLNAPRKQIGLSTAMSDEQLANALSGYDRFWLITALDGESIVSRIQPAFAKKDEFNLTRGLILRLYERQP